MTTEVIDTEAAQIRLQEILGRTEGPSLTGLPVQAPAQPPAPNRKPRSDKGSKKPKKLVENKGVLLPEQVIHIETLFRGVIAAEAVLRKAEKEYEDFLDALTIKK